MADDTLDPIARLQAADPAKAAPVPDVGAIAAKAADRAVVAPLPQRRRAGALIGAVAASIALLAGVAFAGVAIGRSTAPVPEAASAPAPVAEDALPVVGAASPPLPVVAGQAPNAGVGMAAPAAGAPALGAPETQSAVADKAMAIYPGYGVSLIAGPDLPDEPGTAPGYRLDSAGVDQQALARQLAAAFGVEGKPVDQEYGWMVGPIDGSGPAVWIGEDAMVSWSYSDPGVNPWACGPVAEPMPADGTATTEPVAPASCQPSVEPIDEQDAVRQARKILASLGVTDGPVDGVDVEWESGSDEYTTWVTAWQRVDGQRTQLSWSFTFAGKDVAWANGFAAGLVQVPSYPIVGARTAVLRSSDPRYAAFGPTPLDYGGVVPMAGARDDASVSSDASSDIPQGDPRRVQVWWDPATAIDAELTLAQYWQPDGTLLILPAYRVTTADDRGTWALIAVAQTAVEFIAPTP